MELNEHFTILRSHYDISITIDIIIIKRNDRLFSYDYYYVDDNRLYNNVSQASNENISDITVLMIMIMIVRQ